MLRRGGNIPTQVRSYKKKATGVRFYPFFFKIY